MFHNAGDFAKIKNDIMETVHHDIDHTELTSKCNVNKDLVYRLYFNNTENIVLLYIVYIEGCALYDGTCRINYN